MAKSIYDGINDSINNSELDAKIEKFYESDSLDDNFLTFKKINKYYGIWFQPPINGWS